MSTVKARLNLHFVGWPTLLIGFVAIVSGSRQRPMYMENSEFLSNPSLSSWVRLGAAIAAMGLMLIAIAYLRHDEEKI